ncbi:hypothetical protein D7030_13515 [Flavobacteriaceae bacterium AU392]|nr:hypothetical protein D1817_04975 [Flavobacteriaceae bacterium]RKM81320.1 hypothetical protein D7030_13515 [Flavobacteriaceae bacterium AU392]
MKVLDRHNINKLSKILYNSNIMLSGDSQSFIKISEKLILNLQNEYDKDKLRRVIESDLTSTYGLEIEEDKIREITKKVYSWYHN